MSRPARNQGFNPVNKNTKNQQRQMVRRLSKLGQWRFLTRSAALSAVPGLAIAPRIARIQKASAAPVRA